MSPEFLKRPRRVLMTLDAVGGVWRYGVDLTRSLGAQGIDVVLVGLGPEPSACQRTELEGLTNATLLWLREPLDWMASHKEELSTLPKRLAQIVREHEVDLLHLNVPSQARGLYVEQPVIVVSHSCLATWWHEVRREPLAPELEWQFYENRAGLARADLVITPSYSHASTLVRVYGSPKALRVVHNGAALNQPQVPKEPFIFAAARWWDEGKNGRTLDRAAQQCPWPILMAGALEGPNGQSMTPRHARCLGQCSTGSVLEHMARASIFASPSRFEPFGLAVLEAALSGAALVLADIPTFRELWDGVGLFVEPENSAAWRGALEQLASQPEERVRLGRLARQRAEQFSPHRQVEGLLDAYRQASVLASRRAA